MTADVLSIACDLITAERRLDELRAERNGICATCQPPKYEEATGRMWDQIELIEYTPPRSLAECAVKLCLLLSDQGLSVAGAGDDEVCLQQVLSFIEAAALQVGKNACPSGTGHKFLTFRARTSVDFWKSAGKPSPGHDNKDSLIFTPILSRSAGGPAGYREGFSDVR